MGQELFAITISHQIGSSSAPIGKKLSERLNIPFFDREILKRVSDRLHMAEADLEHREERLRSFWQTYSRTAELMDPTLSLTADRYIPTDKELFQLESETIIRIAEKSGAVFIGRCGRHILRGHPRHIHLLLYADPATRIARIRMLFHLGEAEVGKFMEKDDRDRAAYIRAFTGQDWLDARLYDMCLNTSRTGVDGAVDLISHYVNIRFP
ncbi:MAG: cytidylate kinase-like family protein [Anaerolineales bacterium]